MEPVELRGDLVAIEPLRAEHAAALLAAADSEDVFAWLPYPRPRISVRRGLGSTAPSGIAAPIVGSRSRFSMLRTAR
jgi:hypothetical protein